MLSHLKMESIATLTFLKLNIIFDRREIHRFYWYTTVFQNSLKTIRIDTDSIAILRHKKDQKIEKFMERSSYEYKVEGNISSIENLSDGKKIIHYTNGRKIHKVPGLSISLNHRFSLV